MKKTEVIKLPTTKAERTKYARRVLKDKYTQNGWAVHKLRNCINDYIAFQKHRLHFIQININNDTSAKFTGEAKSMFIQNAMSNGARPVYANIIYENKITITYIDANTGEPISIK